MEDDAPDSDRSDPVTTGVMTEQSEVEGRGTRKVGLRAEIDTSAPFGSVKEAVTRFGGSGSWNPYYKGIGDIDIKKVEKLATELEKDLIVKELETLDVLEELGTTKGIVEELKQQIRNEALRRVAFTEEQPTIKKMNKENCSLHVNSSSLRAQSLSPCRADTPDLILTELKQAKLNLGKTIIDLGVIQTSVQSLSKKMKKEKTFLEKAVRSLTSKFAGVLSLEQEFKQTRVVSHPNECQQIGQYSDSKTMVQPEKAEVRKAASMSDQTSIHLQTAELRLSAARKMKEAAKAAETVAMAEINALSSNESSSTCVLPELEEVPLFETRSPLTPRRQNLQNHEAIDTKLSILRRLRELTEEIKQSKQALKEAMDKVEMVNRKQSAVEEAFHKWIPEDDQEGQKEYYKDKFMNSQFPHLDNYQHSPLKVVNHSNLPYISPGPVLRSTTSMRDVLSRKQVLHEESIAARPTEARAGGPKVALSQMLHELRGDITFHPRAEKSRVDQKQYVGQRRKFGFIHISLPMTKPSKKKDVRSNQGPALGTGLVSQNC